MRMESWPSKEISLWMKVEVAHTCTQLLCHKRNNCLIADKLFAQPYDVIIRCMGFKV